ncbi:hypothetical protein GE09DRAFT_711026 [Coniochaeta sp. 2T2.1]|nr:hypothetical protein GE09DRAFT_711026 [Coniochaeta sp. 2T2.1]
MLPTTDNAPTASQQWLTAQKLRRSINQELELAKKATGEGSEIEHFDKLDKLMGYYRLNCIGAVWLDIGYGSKEKIETSLWTTHVSVNAAYRKVKDKYEKSQHMVTKRKIEGLYDKFLKTSQGFYKGYLQRSCARYRNLPALQRLVDGGIVDKLEGLGEGDIVDAVATGIEKQVLASCHLTLIYMGDLWRYRSQLRHRQPERRDFRPALAYYGLANDLDPKSGYAYHQMGVVSLEQEKHFDIIYYFYRSLAAEQPHPTAAKNLETGFKRVLQSTTTPQGQGPHRVLQDWVVRLHAHFYRGKEFPQHAELEDEVVHRLGLAVKAHDFADGLLKLVLINICAYQVAKDKITNEWTPEGSQSCQFTLLLNIRTLFAILREMEPDLSNMVETMRTSPSAPNGTAKKGSTEEGNEFNPLLTAALPLLRIYMTWLCMYRSDIVEFESYLRPYILHMYKSLSVVLSSLFEILARHPGLKPVPLLFNEDMETRGLKALNGPAIPIQCLLGVDSISCLPKSRGEESGSENIKADEISFTRALDITTCGVTLTDDPVFPLDISLSPGGSHMARVTYQAGGKKRSPPSASAGVVAMSYPSPGMAAVDLATALSVRPSPTVAATNVARGPVPAVTTNLDGLTNGFTDALRLPLVSPLPPQLAEESNYAVDHDSRMNELVNGLVEPSESDPSEAAPAKNETSYDMHTGTARDVFASAIPSASPGLTPTHNGVPSLPWAWGPVAQPMAHQRNISSGDSRNAWSSAAALAEPFSNRNSTSVVPANGNTPTDNAFAAASNAQYASGQRTFTDPTTSSLWQHSHQHSSGVKSTSTPVGLPGQTFYGSAANANNPWSQGSSKFSSIQDILGAQLGALVPGFHPVASTSTPTAAAVPSSFASTNFSGNTSSLPPVNSPRGLPNKQAVNAHPKPMGKRTPPGLSTTSRPNSTGNGVSGYTSWRQDNAIAPKVPPCRQPTSPSNGPSSRFRTGTASIAATMAVQPPQERDQADYNAMLRKLQRPKS